MDRVNGTVIGGGVLGAPETASFAPKAARPPSLAPLAGLRLRRISSDISVASHAGLRSGHKLTRASTFPSRKEPEPASAASKISLGPVQPPSASLRRKPIHPTVHFQRSHSSAESMGSGRLSEPDSFPNPDASTSLKVPLLTPQPRRTVSLPAAPPLPKRARNAAVRLTVALSMKTRDAAQAAWEQATTATHYSYVAATVDAAAAVLSLATTQLATHPTAAKATGVASGLLWMGAGALSEVANVPHSRAVRRANLLTFTAGAIDLAAPFTHEKGAQIVAYGSSFTWAASGLAYMLRSALTHRQSPLSRVCQGLSGVINIGAAGLAFYSAQASAKGNTALSIGTGTGASLLWVAAAGFSGAAARAGAPSDCPNRSNVLA